MGEAYHPRMIPHGVESSIAGGLREMICAYLLVVFLFFFFSFSFFCNHALFV